MGAPPATPEDRGGDQSQSVKFHYIKSNFFRVIHADGAWGGVNPKGFVQFAVYSERGAIPRETIQRQTGDGWGQEEIVETRGGVVREVEAEVVMDINTAISFHIWFAGKMELLQKQLNIPDAEWAKMTGALTAAEGKDAEK